MYALILAGGKGERLHPRTESVPKPMIRAAGRPILWHQVRWLRKAGVTDVIFLVGHLADVVTDYFGNGADSGIRAHYSREDTPLGRGGALKSSWYGDCLPSRDFPMLIDLHLQGRLPLDRFVSETIGINEVEQAFEKMERGEVLRSVVVI